MGNIIIRDLLKGYAVDRSSIQNVGIMTVIPLIADQEYTPIASLTDIYLNRDIEYNRLSFGNSSDEIGILLQGYTIISKQKAQDRTIPYPHLIKGKSRCDVPANCIQPGQCGHFDQTKLHSNDFKVLPPSLRALAMQKSTFGTGETGALWDSLSSWVRDLNLREQGLVSFYEKFAQQLDEFVASFEPVNKQLGAITILNKEIIAIDIVPKYDSWLQIFRPLIRDSYGAEACRLIQNKQIESLVELFDTTRIESASDLEKSFNIHTEAFLDKIKEIVDKTIALEATYKMLQEMNDLTLVQFKSNDFLGCGVYHDDHIVYLSLVSTNIMKRKEKISDLKQNKDYSNRSFEV